MSSSPDTEHPLLRDLNDEQKAAVCAEPASALILAGAGSGKTRVLVHRIAWLCDVEQYSPYAVLAVTFTNKAATEMRERVAQLMGIPVRGMWVGTFHGICHRILRSQHKMADLPASFQVIDAQDQQRLVKRIITGLNLDIEVKEAKQFINDHKERGQRAAQITAEDPEHELLIHVYKRYEEHCQRFALLDFAELLLRTVELFENEPSVLQNYQIRFRYILVDEFQDTNALQYTWLKLLAGKPTKGGDAQTPLFAVGDDDQSIYGWRGACTENIEHFSDDFNQAKIYRLERNYRSTSTILNAANALIQNNKSRMGKNLWTEEGDGEPIHIFAAFDERDEAQFVIDQTAQWLERGRAYRECAVLYRSNAQSRLLEDMLVAQSIPYQIYGGMRFFERAVIKHALAYLRIAANPNDDPSYDRVVNFPPRGIGKQSLSVVRAHANEAQCSMWNAGIQCIEGEVLNTRAAGALARFYQVVKELREDLPGQSLAGSVEHVVDLLKAHYKEKRDETSISCMENLDELVVAAREFESNFDPDELEEEEGQPENVTDAFLTRASLDAGEAQAGSGEDYLQMMTLHSAKGLEFPFVVIIGCDEFLFPHERSTHTLQDLEEERRLCYVGITRAKECLAMTYAEERRRIYGNHREPSYPSRFLEEIPKELVKEERRQRRYTHTASDMFSDTQHQARSALRPAPAQQASAPDAGLAVGAFVHHDSFGAGVVMNLEGSGINARALVRFESGSEKWLILHYANLTQQ